jgi:hypothetical protein
MNKKTKLQFQTSDLKASLPSVENQKNIEEKLNDKEQQKKRQEEQQQQ